MSGVDSEDVKELLNDRKAFDFVAESVLGQGIITESVIREIDQRLVERGRGYTAQPGQYRMIQNNLSDRQK